VLFIHLASTDNSVHDEWQINIVRTSCTHMILMSKGSPDVRNKFLANSLLDDVVVCYKVHH
jgi:hypothetical protein